jgi:UDP-3-O-[3-hydroxymyristoyl] glucosamine N-acyltransferase
MKKIVNIIYDTNTPSINAKNSLFLGDEFEVNAIEINIADIDAKAKLISELDGALIVLTSPETFSLYRSKIYQMISLNNKLTSFSMFDSIDKINIPKWTFINQNVRLSGGVKIGLMTYIGSNTTIAANTAIGNFCWIGDNVTIGSNVSIGNHVTIHDNTLIGSSTKIEKFNEIRHSVKANTDYSDKRIETDFFDAVAYYHNV